MIERPLTLFLNGQEIVTVMTVGDYPEFLAVGYLFDSINASNGDADFDALTFDAIYSVSSGPHAFGFGGTNATLVFGRVD